MYGRSIQVARKVFIKGLCSMKPKSDTARSAALAERKKAQGLAKMSHSRWVPIEHKAECTEAARTAVDGVLAKHTKAST